MTGIVFPEDLRYCYTYPDIFVAWLREQNLLLETNYDDVFAPSPEAVETMLHLYCHTQRVLM